MSPPRCHRVVSCNPPDELDESLCRYDELCSKTSCNPHGTDIVRNDCCSNLSVILSSFWSIRLKSILITFISLLSLLGYADGRVILRQRLYK